MDFPHLNDTSFPDLGNVDVYGYRNDFDYKRWVPGTRLMLCNVRWNGDYADVVKFGSDEERDAWFDSIVTNPDACVELETNMTFVKDSVKVPLPYDVATQYNYLVVDVPIATSRDDMLDYERDDGFRRWHFFVNDFQSNGASTTTLTLALDVWTQYVNNVGVSYLVLERGHAPVSATDTDTYLSNPIENSEMLLAPDVDAGGDTVSRGGQFVPFGNGEKVLCIASSCTPSQLSEIGTASSSGSATFGIPTFSDEQGYPNEEMRWGRQYHVDGYGWGSGTDYSDVSTPTGNATTSDGRIPNNATVYAFPASDTLFLADLLAKSPSFLSCALAFFEVPRDLVTLGTRHYVAGHEMWECVGGESDLGRIELTRDMFGIPDRYQRFAKLYTFPYSRLEVTDNEGHTAEVRVESTSGIKARSVVALAYPYLNMRMFLTGIGGVGSSSYQWRDLRGVHDCELPLSDWRRFCYDFDVPMYSLYMDGSTSWQLQNYNRQLSNGRNSALVSYHNGVRSANNTYANEVDAADTIKTNNDNSADNAYTNAVNSANTARTNTYNNANTTDNNNANARACASDINANNNAAHVSNTTQDMSYQINITQQMNSRDNNLRDNDNDVTIATSTAENQKTAATAQNEAYASVVNAAVSAIGGIIATSANAGAGNIAGAAGAAVNAFESTASNLISAVLVKNNSQTVVDTNTEIANIVKSNNTFHVNTGNSFNNASTRISNEATQTKLDTAVTTATNNTNRSNQLNKSNTDNTTGTMRTNATNTRDTSVTNATNTRGTAKANNSNSRNNAVSNAGWTRDVEIANLQDSLRNTQNAAKAALADSRNARPLTLTPSKGSPEGEYMRTRGVQVRVRTESAAAMRAAGDAFVRYGYALNQIWDVDESGLCLMKHFTYWKASDCWVYDRNGTSDVAQNTISAILRAGTTVWSNPDEIGRVNPYDN